MVRLLIDCPVTLMTDNFIRTYSNIGQRSNQCSTGYVVFVSKVSEGGARSSGRSTSAQNRPFIAIPRRSLTRTVFFNFNFFCVC